MNNPIYVSNANDQVYISGSLKIIVPHSNVVIYTNVEHKELRVYRGTKFKPESVRHFHHSAPVELVKKEMKSTVDYYIKNAKANHEIELKWKEETALVKKNTKVGDIFFSEWGHEQTNICFYQVVAIKGASYTLREINKERIEKGNTMTGVVVPLIGQFVDENQMVRRVVNGGFKIEGREIAKPLAYTVEENTGSRIYVTKEYTAYA